MKGKIIKGIIAALLLCCISVPLSGCAFVNPDVRENFENWTDDFLGGIFGDADDKDDKKEPSTDGSTNSGNEDDENGGNTNIETETFIGNGVIFYDHVNDIMIRPERTTVTVGETFAVNVADCDGDPIDYELSYTVYGNPENAGVISVDDVGNVTALKTGEGVLGIKVGDVQSYYVTVTVVAEDTPNETYVLSARHQYATQTITLSHYEVVMKTGESFTIELTTTTTESPTFTVKENGGEKYTSINDATVTAMSVGKTYVGVSLENDVASLFLIAVTIIE